MSAITTPQKNSKRYVYWVVPSTSGLEKSIKTDSFTLKSILKISFISLLHFVSSLNYYLSQIGFNTVKTCLLQNYICFSSSIQNLQLENHIKVLTIKKTSDSLLFRFFHQPGFSLPFVKCPYHTVSQLSRHAQETFLEGVKKLEY